MEVDVAIIGAGPAGSATAALLASRGVSTALIDRDQFPRDKLCGEFLSYDAQPVVDLLGLREELERFPPIRTCRVVGSRGHFEFQFPRPARGASRWRFDELLLRRAGMLGAGVMEGWTAAGLERLDDRWNVRLEKKGAETAVRARVLVGAWGRWGRFDRQIKRSFIEDRRRRHFGFKRHYRGPVSDGTIELYSFSRGYLGVSPIENGLTNICGLVHLSRLTGLKGGWDAFIADIRKERKILERLFASHEPAQEGYLSSDPVIFHPRDPMEQGVFMVGDASGIVDPLTGNGMAMGLQGALLAAPFILRELTSAGSAADAYRAAHADFFHTRIRWSRRISHLLSRPGLLEGALRLAPWKAAGRFLLEKTRAADRKLAEASRRWERA